MSLLAKLTTQWLMTRSEFWLGVWTRPTSRLLSVGCWVDQVGGRRCLLPRVVAVLPWVREVSVLFSVVVVPIVTAAERPWQVAAGEQQLKFSSEQQQRTTGGRQLVGACSSALLLLLLFLLLRAVPPTPTVLLYSARNLPRSSVFFNRSSALIPFMPLEQGWAKPRACLELGR